MAVYKPAGPVNKRVRFFDGQFLQDQDFIDEQNYHLDRERRLNRVLRVSGIAEGLVVTSGAPNQVTVSKGAAVDALGRQLVLAADTTVRLPAAQFSGKQGIALHLIYREIATDVSQTGTKSERRWDESPMLAAVAPDTTVAVAPEDASTTWDGPTVVLATVAVSANGAVSLDTGATLTLRVERGLDVRADTTTAAGWYEALRLGRPEQSAITHSGGRLLFGLHTNRSFYFGDIDGGSLKKYVMKIDGGTGDVGIGSGDDKPGARLEVRGGGGTSVDLLVNGRLRSNSSDGGLWVGSDRFVGGATLNAANHVGFYNNNAWRLTVRGSDGNVGISTADPGSRLTVSASALHAQLRRENSEKAGATQLFLELFQDDTGSPKVPETYPTVRFHHANRFWHRIEAQSSGFHLKDGNLGGNGYSSLFTGGLTATGNIALPGAQQLVFADGDTSNNLKVQLWGGYGLGINGGTLFYAANGRHSWRDNAGATERMALTTGADGALSVLGTGTSTVAGQLSVGPVVGSARLSVSASGAHLQLRREASEKAGGNQIFLELYQDDTRPRVTVPETYSAIRFHHNNRFWHRLEARVDGLHVKDGDPTNDSYKSLTAGALFSTGQLGVGTSTIENPENWERVVDIRCTQNARLSMRTLDGSLDGRVLLHNTGFWGAAPGMIIGTRGPHSLSFVVGSGPRLVINQGGQVVARADVFIEGGLIVNIGGWKRFWRRDFDKLIGGDDVPGPLPSDARLKTAVRPITDALRTVRRLTGLRYRWAETGLDYLTRDVADSVSAGPDATPDEHREVGAAEVRRARAALGGEDIGMLAQDVETVVPEVVREGRDGYKHIRYQQLTALLIEAVKEQQALIEGLSARISAAEGR
jgi:Chaperone of endosialidase